MHLKNLTPTCHRLLYRLYLRSTCPTSLNRAFCSQFPTSSTVLNDPENENKGTKRIKKEKTVFLPKTNFLAHVKSVERSNLDSELAIMGKFQELYEWQLNDPERKELPRFRLLDGPPYANGQPHVGHAVNKVIKDFIVKSRIQLGYRVHYQPGWDCHGLPIELKIAKEAKATNPLEIRQNARHVASTSMMSQMSVFKKWGVTSHWTRPYLTMNADYVANQLEIFAKLYEKGVIYRAFKPVYWSPSSKTALAESELEYNDKHESLAAYFRYQVINLSLEDLGLSHLKPPASNRPAHLFAMIWTTTPWTLPMNNAIAFSEKLKYAAIEFEDDKKSKPIREIFIVAANLVRNIEKETKRALIVHTTFESSLLNGVFYRNPLYNELAQPFLPASYVAGNVGTGLVHSSYAHGHDDYALALSRDEKVECFVSEDGRYTRHMGHQLEGKEVLTDGSKFVLELFKKHVIHSYKYVHSYPYDWRTKKPVIIRSSQQWFMDVSEIGQKCVDLLKNEIFVGNKQSDQINAMIPLILNRPAWCISRQRAWGVPIPALIRKNSHEAVISTNLIHRVAELIRNSGTSDIWWKLEPAEILDEKLKQELNLKESDLSELEKGGDIMDVWMDSGVAWNLSKNENGKFEQADVIIEGLDQFRGWFLSTLLTSMAINDCAPYKRILVHGFCVDEDGEKMSKSVGNVIDPDMITDGSLKQKALGADGLRLWVALYGSEAVSNIRIGKTVLEDIDTKISQIRTSFRFLLGALDGYDMKEPEKLNVLDQFIIVAVKRFLKRTEQNYGEYRFRAVINEFIQFLQNPLSTAYVHFIKDRLYCDHLQSDPHLAACYTISLIGRSLIDLISTILPYLAVEFYSYHPALKNSSDQVLKRRFTEILEDIEKSEEKFTMSEKELDEVMECVLKIRSKIAELAEGTNSKGVLSKRGIQISGSEKDLQILRKIQPEGEAFFSELVELLGTSYVKLETTESQDLQIEIISSPLNFCSRCRKHNRKTGDNICDRCLNAESNISC